MNNEIELVEHISDYYSKSCCVLDEFGGPSVYFHVQAVKEQGLDFMSKRHIEMIYATLASWGMHRMGDPAKTRAKMVEFSSFERSLASQVDLLSELRRLKMHECGDEEYRSHIDSLKDIFDNLRVSISDSVLVAHSKTLAHILPYLVPPIDRQYTIRFFTQDDKDFFTASGKYRTVAFPIDQFSAFRNYCIRIKWLFDQCDRSIFEINPDTFNTSYPKIMDNVIMAFVKSVPKPTRTTGAA